MRSLLTAAAAAILLSGCSFLAPVRPPLQPPIQVVETCPQFPPPAPASLRRPNSPALLDSVLLISE